MAVGFQSRRSLLAALAVAVAVPVIGGGRASAVGGPDEVMVAQTSDSLTWAANYIASEEGFFEKQGIKANVQIMSGGDPQTVAALHSGTAQFGAMTTILALQAIAKGEKLRMVSPYVRQFVAQVVINKESAAKAGITEGMPTKNKVSRLRGLVIGTLDVGGGLDLLLRGLAKGYGMDPTRDFTITAIHSYTGLLAACRRGQVDAAMVGIPFGTLGVQQDDLMMFTDFWSGAVPEFNGAMHSGLFVLNDVAQRNPGLVLRMHAAINEALAFIHNHPEDAVKDLHKRFSKLPESVLQSLVVNAKGFPSQAIVDRKGFDVVRDFVAGSVNPEVAKIGYDSVVLPIARL